MAKLVKLLKFGKVDNITEISEITKFGKIGKLVKKKVKISDWWKSPKWKIWHKNGNSGICKNPHNSTAVPQSKHKIGNGGIGKNETTIEMNLVKPVKIGHAKNWQRRNLQKSAETLPFLGQSRSQILP